MAVSIFERKRDLVYLVFFVVHLPVMLGKCSSLEALVYFTSIATPQYNDPAFHIISPI
jgi:hypothetical protein